MATWIDFIRTNKGLALDAKLISRTLPLTITKAMSGEGRVSPLLLREQTELALPKQILSLGEKQQTDDYAAIMLPVKLSNEGIDLKYSMYQIGVFADDPDEGEILYMICQTSTEEGEEVPSEKEQPAFSIQWNLKIKVSDTDDVVVQVADVGMITQDEADKRYPVLDAQGNVPEEKLPEIAKLALGETAQTAYRGDRGKAAYDHSVKTSGNPHGVTKIDVGLGSVDNTSDANKPVSTAMQTALDKKVDKAAGKGLSSNDFTVAYKAKLDNAPEDINSVLTLSEGNKTRYGAGTFDQAFNKAVQILTATVPASGWSSTPTLAGWYENRVTVAGMQAVYNPLLDLVITNATLAEDERAAFGLIMEAETFDGYVIFRALDKPDISFNVRFVGV